MRAFDFTTSEVVGFTNPVNGGCGGMGGKFTFRKFGTVSGNRAADFWKSPAYLRKILAVSVSGDSRTLSEKWADNFGKFQEFDRKVSIFP